MASSSDSMSRMTETIRRAETMDSDAMSRMTETSSSKAMRRAEAAARGGEKKRRLGDAKEKILQVSHLKGTSQRALHQIISQLQAQDDHRIGRDVITEVGRQRFKEVARTIKLPLQIPMREHDWEVADPTLLVGMTLRESPRMTEAFASALARSPCSPESPWGLVIAFDEFTPGSLLRPDNWRKAMVTNFTFLELGPATYSDSAWWTVAVARTRTIAQVVGGWSRMLRDLLKFMLLSPTGLMTAGIPLVINGQHVCIFAKVACLLSDGDGLRQALQWMGSGSMKPCFRHWNVLKKNSERAIHSRGAYVEIDCHEPGRFQCWTHAELQIAIDVVVLADQQFHAGQITKERYEHARTRLGFKATREGLLADPELRARMDFIDVLRYDWAHTFLSDGIIGAEIWALIDKGAQHGLFDQDTVHAFLCEPWQLPAANDKRRLDARRLFSEHARKANDDHQTIKGSMSDLLGLYGLLRHFVEDRVPRMTEAEGAPRMTEAEGTPRITEADGRIAAEVRNFMLACKAVDLLVAAKRRQIPVRDAGHLLLATLQQHLESHVQSSGNRRVRPKSHWSFDVAQCMIQDGFLFDCFTTERLHLRAKRVADNCKNLGDFEGAVMAGVTNVHMRTAAASVSPAGLIGATAAFPGAPHIVVADKCQYYGVYLSLHDFVFRGAACGLGAWSSESWVGS